MTRVTVAGVGNVLRRDDGAGPAVALRVARAARGVEVLVEVGEPTDLIEHWRSADVAIVIDAMRAGLEVGATRRYELGPESSPLGDALPPAASTHLLPLPHVVELARALGAMPVRLLIYGVQGDVFGPGEGLSPAVAAAVERVAAEVLDEVGAAMAP